MQNNNADIGNCYRKLMSMRRSQIRDLLEQVQSSLPHLHYTTYQRIASVCLTKHKPDEKPKRKRIFLTTPYINKASELVPPELLCRAPEETHHPTRSRTIPQITHLRTTATPVAGHVLLQLQRGP